MPVFLLGMVIGRAGEILLTVARDLSSVEISFLAITISDLASKLASKNLFFSWDSLEMV